MSVMLDALERLGGNVERAGRRLVVGKPTFASYENAGEFETDDIDAVAAHRNRPVRGVEVGRPEMMRVEVGKPEMGMAEMYKMARGADIGSAVQPPAMPRMAQIAPRQPLADYTGVRAEQSTRMPRPPVSEPARRRAPRQRPAAPWYQDEAQVQDVAASLVSKGIQGTAAPGPGIVPYGALPEAFRKAVGDAAGTLVGFDPGKLDPRERELLMRLMGAAEREAQTRRAAQPSQPIAMAGGPR